MAVTIGTSWTTLAKHSSYNLYTGAYYTTNGTNVTVHFGIQNPGAAPTSTINYNSTTSNSYIGIGSTVIARGEWHLSTYGRNWNELGSYTYAPGGSSSGSYSFSVSWSLVGYNTNMGDTIVVPAGAVSGSYYWSAITGPSNVGTSPSYIVPGGAVTVTWTKGSNGNNNAITGYDISLSCNGATVGSGSVGAGSASASITLNSGATRGKTITATVTAKAPYGNKSASGGSAIVNRLPTISAAASGSTLLPSTGGTPKFTVSSGNGGDSLTITTLISINDGTWTNYGGSVSAITSLTSYRFRAYDGQEYAYSGYITYTINTKPVISSTPTITTVNYSPGASATYPLAYKFSTTLPTILSGKTISKYLAMLRYSDAVSTVTTGTIVEFLETTTLPNGKNISEALASRGKYFLIGIRVNDGIEWSNPVWDTNTTYYTPLNINNITNISESHVAQYGYIKDTVNLTWTDPSVDALHTALTKWRVTRTIGSGVEIAILDWTSSHPTISDDVSTVLSRGQAAIYIIYVLDDLGNLTSSTFTVVKALDPLWTTGTYLGVNRTTFNPYNDSSNILQPVLSNTASGDVPILSYEVLYYVNDNKYLTIYNGNLTGSTILIPYTAVTSYSNFCSKLWNNTYLGLNNNTIYKNTKFRVRATDVYSHTTDWLYSSTIKVGNNLYYGDIDLIFCVSPTINTSSTTIKLGYDLSTSSSSLVTLTSGKTAISNEYIVVGAVATDVNTGDILKYELLYATTQTISGGTPTGWSAYSVIVPQLAGTTLTYKLKHVDTDTYVKFRLVVYDSTYTTYGTAPAIYDFNNAWILVAAVKMPFIRLTGLSLNGTNTTLSVTWDALGSGASSSPNTAGSGNWKTNRLAASSAFDGAQVCSLRIQTTTNRADFDTGTITGNNGYKDLTTTTATSTSITLTLKTRTYVRATLTFKTGKNGSSYSTTTYYSNILVLYVTEPVVSYHKTGLGVGSSSLSNDLILNILGAAATKKITTGASWVEIDTADTQKGTLHNFIVGSDVNLLPALANFNIDGGTY